MVTLPGFTAQWTRQLASASEVSGATIDGALFVLDDAGVLSAFDAGTGEPRWRTRVDASHLGALCATDDGVLVTLPDKVVRAALRDGATSQLAAAEAGSWTAPATKLGERLLLPTANGPIDVISLRSGALLYQLPGNRGAHAFPCREGVVVGNADRSLSFFSRLP